MSLVSEVQELLDDAGVFWIPQHVYDAVNEAQIYVQQDLRWDVAVATATLTANQTYLTIPTAIMIPQRIVANNVEYYPTTYVHMERDDRRWRAESQAAPGWFIIHDAHTLRIHPRPDATYVYEMWGIQYPQTEITTGTEDATQPRIAMGKAIVYRAAIMLVHMTRPQLAEVWGAELQRHLNDAHVLIRTQSSHYLKRMRPGKLITRAHQGDRTSGWRLLKSF